MPVCSEGRGALGAACVWLAPTQLLCVNRAAAALGRAEDAAVVPEGCLGWFRVPAGLGQFPEPGCGAGACCFTGGKGFGQGLPHVHDVLRNTAGLGFCSPWSLWSLVQ